MKRALARSVVSFLCLAFLPAAAYAQASFSGIVKDTSGAVLPGVNVEASSPVLIEKSRSATTDSAGRYIIPDLRPGTYRVTFTLPGFKTVVREGVELLGTGVVTINADMAIGTVEETITVSGATRHGRPAEHHAAGVDHPGDRLGASELADSVRARRAHSRRHAELRRP